MKCEFCHYPEARYVEDPFAADVYGDKTLHWLCEKCLEEQASDI